MMGNRFGGLAFSTQGHHMMIGDSGIVQRLPEGALIELRVPARSRERAHVGKRFNSMGAEQGDEFLDRMGRMSDRKNRFR